MKSRFPVWYNNEVTINSQIVPGPGPGRPSTSYDDTESERTKRHKTSVIRAENSGSLLFAASMKFREEGNEKCAKILKLICDQPEVATELLEFVKQKRSCSEGPINLSGQEALSLVLDADLGKSQYQTIRSTAKNHNPDIFPAYNKVVEEKKDCFPHG